MNTFHYSGQVRRFVMQFIRLISYFQVEYGKNEDGSAALRQVPVYYGDSSRQVAQILTNNSENAMRAVPAMAVYITDLTYDRDRVQEPMHVSKMHLRMRDYDHDTGTYGTTQGDAFTIERLMPSPYLLKLNVDIWTSNTTQKLQILEQLYPWFNPSLEIQSTDNYIDWTSLSTVTLMNTRWDTRTIPAGTGEEISINTMSFEIPIWLSMPAKVKKLGVIQKVIASVFDAKGELDEKSIFFSEDKLLARNTYSPMNYAVLYINGMLQLVRADNSVKDEKILAGKKDSWRTLANLYGTLTNGSSIVRLEQANGATVVGTVTLHPEDDTLLLYEPFVDTIPANNLDPVDAIIDPYNMSVHVLNLPAGPAVGTRFLIVNSSIGSEEARGASMSPIAWGDLIAEENDIVEWNGTEWFVSFNAGGTTEIKYVTNLKTGAQYKWDGTGWKKSVDGLYRPGDWSITL